MSQEFTNVDALVPTPGRTLPPAPPPPAPLAPAESESGWTADNLLRWLKESVAALIAIALVTCLVLMIWQGYGAAVPGVDDKYFARVKDLLLFINPLVGVVIGYYFNRVSTEARAESAERTANRASTEALQAHAALGESQAQAQSSKSEAEEARAALGELIPAAEDVLSDAPLPGPPVALGSAAAVNNNGPAAAPTVARLNLQRALERARSVAARGAR